MTLDLVKAYDMVDRYFMRLLRIDVDLDFEITQWIMGCIESTNFVVLINGQPSAFFKRSRGMRHGCPLSPLLFLSVIKGLSKLIDSEKQSGKIKGIKVSSSTFITYLIFDNDVLIFGIGFIS